jgi:hypothetical protein
MLALAAFAAMVEGAWAQDDPSRAALGHAVQLYLAGDTEAARASLQAILATGPSLPANVRREALLWLGDLLYADVGADAARNVFESLLAEDPAYPIDRFAHSPEVVALFDSLRPVARPVPAPPELPDFVERPDGPAAPWPWKVLLPGGVGYFIDDKPVAGAVVGGIQAVGLGVSIATYVQLREDYPAGKWPEPGQYLEEGGEERVEAFRTTLAINRVSASLAVAAWLLPIPIETGVWAGRRRVTMVVGPNTVTFAGRF